MSVVRQTAFEGTTRGTTECPTRSQASDLSAARLRQAKMRSAIGDAVTVLTEADATEEALQNALAAIADAGEFSSACVIELNDQGGAARPRPQLLAGWGARDRTPLGNSLALLDMRPWIDASIHSDHPLDALIGDLPDKTLRGVLKEAKVAYVVCCPIQVNENYWGWVRFDDTTSRRCDASERQILQSAAIIMARVARRGQLRRNSRDQATDAEGAGHSAEPAPNDASLNALLFRLSSGSDLDTLSDALSVEVTSRLHADGSQLVLYDEAKDELFTVAGVAKNEPERFQFPATIQASGAGCFEVLRDRRTPRYFDLDREPQNFWPGTVEYHRRFGSQTVLVTPLHYGDRFAGFLGVAFLRRRELTQDELDLLQSLGHQAALAVQLIRAGKHERELAVTREREAATQARAAELEVANVALQRLVDATASLDGLEGFISKALRIVAEALNASGAGYFEHPADTIFLRFWLDHGVVYGPDELPSLNGDDLTTVREMASGFTVSPAHLGVDYRRRSSPSVVHHTKATASPALHNFCRSRGWAWELNVPLMVNGVSCAAITLHRDEQQPFSTGEVALGETLGKQVALAIQVNRLAERDREAAIAAEQAAELARANAVLSRSLSHATVEETTDVLMARMVKEIGDIAGAQCSALMLEEPDRGLTMPLLFLDGEPVDPQSDRAHPMCRQTCQWSDFPSGVALSDDQLVAEELDALAPRLWPPSNAWHYAQGHQALAMVPLRHGDRTIGILGLGFVHSPVFDRRTSALLRALANQLGLVAALEQAAAKAREAVVLRERESAARQRADTLAQANAALTRSTAQLASGEGLSDFLTAVLMEAINAAGAVSGAVFIHDAAKQTLSAEAFIMRGAVVNVATDPLGAAFRAPRSTADDPAWGAMAVDKKVLWMDYDNPSPIDWPEALQFHRALGHRYVADVPMIYRGTAIGFLGLCFDKSAELSLDENTLEVAQVLAQQAVLAVRLTRLAEDARTAALDVERGRVAGEIHDGLAQGFTAILMQARAALLSDEDSHRHLFLRRIEALAADGVSEARRSVFALRSVTLEADGLIAALTRLVDNCAITGQIDCQLQSHGPLLHLTPALEDSAYRIVQESLQNALKYADARTIVVHVGATQGQLTVTVDDDGTGIAEDIISQARERGGLRAMRERAATGGGVLTVTRVQPHGTRVSVSYPLPPP
ncbi:hypothetical protein B4U45_22595 [Mycobacterium persicum]|uniref:Histidine kinase domain-containing protein n=4 Tax=Mycobacterium TaxID=1763 RepID=A0A2A3L9Q6_MYCAV|nr:GAF domain-containing protein [Mycobacterium kansasii]ORC08964.1 hypothetical protein B4U45_22595 [Mycobacterium persicum]PBA25281.1 hypothetical protein CKJ66_19515 [Mycobacterium avium]PBJ36180.1 hypothetical protein XV03_10370 [Mycobacterium avium subsp. hominissuis]PBA40399.1 hypothetical protein CKJ63_17925 [Mycobacterium avium]